jgi:hypothetical protein
VIFDSMFFLRFCMGFKTLNNRKNNRVSKQGIEKSTEFFRKMSKIIKKFLKS